MANGTPDGTLAPAPAPLSQRPFNGHARAFFTGVYRFVVSGLLLAGVLAMWEFNGTLSALEVHAIDQDTSIARIFDRLVWVERALNSQESYR